MISSDVLRKDPKGSEFFWRIRCHPCRWVGCYGSCYVGAIQRLAVTALQSNIGSRNAQQIQGPRSACAAILADGSVVTWGPRGAVSVMVLK